MVGHRPKSASKGEIDEPQARLHRTGRPSRRCPWRFAACESTGRASPPAESLNLPKKPYSPYAAREFPTRPFWGDTHLHTSYSMDAGAFGARLSPADAYRFARGEEVVSSTGQRVRLARPLDFLVVADHSDGMGTFPRLFSGDPEILSSEKGRTWYDVQRGGQDGVQAALEIISGFSQGTLPEGFVSLPGQPAYRGAWDDTVKAAEDANEAPFHEVGRQSHRGLGDHGQRLRRGLGSGEHP